VKRTTVSKSGIALHAFSVTCPSNRQTPTSPLRSAVLLVVDVDVVTDVVDVVGTHPRRRVARTAAVRHRLRSPVRPAAVATCRPTHARQAPSHGQLAATASRARAIASSGFGARDHGQERQRRASKHHGRLVVGCWPSAEEAFVSCVTPAVDAPVRCTTELRTARRPNLRYRHLDFA
jgi:hypothetical protein